jgi:hypothetical protein
MFALTEIRRRMLGVAVCTAAMAMTPVVFGQPPGGPGKGFDKKGFSGKPFGGPKDEGRGSSETERLQAQVKELRAELEHMQDRLQAAMKALDKATAKSDRGPDRKGPPFAMGKFGGKDGPDHKGPPFGWGKFAKDGPDRKGPPAWGDRSRFGPPEGRGQRPSFAFEGRRMNPPFMRDGGRGPFADRGRSSVEDRLDRLQRDLDELRRELRSRR